MLALAQSAAGLSWVEQIMCELSDHQAAATPNLDALPSPRDCTGPTDSTGPQLPSEVETIPQDGQNTRLGKVPTMLYFDGSTVYSSNFDWLSLRRIHSIILDPIMYSSE